MAVFQLINRTPSPTCLPCLIISLLLNISLINFSLIMLFVLLGVFVFPKTKRQKELNLLIRVGNMFMGYLNGKKGWKLFDLDIKEVLVSPDVKFLKVHFHSLFQVKLLLLQKILFLPMMLLMTILINYPSSLLFLS